MLYGKILVGYKYANGLQAMFEAGIVEEQEDDGHVCSSSDILVEHCARNSDNNLGAKHGN
jgi:hypothetical protein